MQVVRIVEGKTSGRMARQGKEFMVERGTGDGSLTRHQNDRAAKIVLLCDKA
jgi:hypothetical protein